MDEKQLYQLIEEVLKGVGAYSKSAQELIFMTICHESACGKYIRQVNGPALGIMQMEPKTYMDLVTWAFSRKPDYLLKAKMFCNVGQAAPSHTLVYNSAWSIAIGRLYYLRISEPLPDADNIQSLAYYYKRYWNTFEGKARIEDVIRHYTKAKAKL